MLLLVDSDTACIASIGRDAIKSVIKILLKDSRL